MCILFRNRYIGVVSKDFQLENGPLKEIFASGHDKITGMGLALLP